MIIFPPFTSYELFCSQVVALSYQLLVVIMSYQLLALLHKIKYRYLRPAEKTDRQVGRADAPVNVHLRFA